MSERARPNATPCCAICVHGYEQAAIFRAAIFCAPQSRSHPCHYLCSGFRHITIKEIDERSDARMGREIKPEELKR